MTKRKNGIDEKTLTKMQIRKLNALRRSVGERIGEDAFQRWYETQRRPEEDADHNVAVITRALSRVRNQLKFPRGGGYIVRQGKGRVVVEPAAIRKSAGMKRRRTAKPAA